jgi:hypothetical protein
MNLKDADEILLQLNMLLDKPCYSKEQRETIKDCIEVVKNTPTESRYTDLGPQVSEAIRHIKYSRKSL